MPRPKRCRRVCCDPQHDFFKPRGIPLSRLEHVDLRLDELEALRLSDLDGRSQAEAADGMDISQPTFNRILGSARAKVADALINGKAIMIESSSADVSRTDTGTKCHCRHRRHGPNARGEGLNGTKEQRT